MAENSWTPSSSSYYSSALASDMGRLSHSSALGYSPPLIVSGRPTWPVNMPSKGRVRTCWYRSAAPAQVSLIPGGIGAASCVALGGAGWGLAAGRSTGGGFCLLDGKTCSRRLASRNTCVARTTLNPAQASSDPLPGDARRRWMCTMIDDGAR